ncbi:ABC transporter permease [Sporomusa acidovorans]|uniref:Aliphatic sulfonates transport permease protein SsuC n=1 Tax=Sporomusa acidovorans (strain ATCC 49682 / DSM 3132 / Mol) TaxID=1123286 RepID=A0ABZ3JA83_SPOA4|nr:ABC transporter permease [Sporomusa acidovorans]OZC22913.1 putative aliphatic sulfonates transport permease protein SsuC [Sporomusa acidovorans DSM 3132]SDE95410.1 NitT/TauT family transport system permease protein [Sporomusa acidovorans]
MVKCKLLTPKAEIATPLYVALSALTFALLAAVWSALTYSDAVPPMFLPSPDKVVKDGVLLFTQFDLMSDIGASVFRVTVGFLLAAVIAVPLGIMMGSLKICEALTEPVLSFIRYMPASAFIPLFILWLGIGESEKIAVIFFGTFFPLALMIMDVTKNVAHDLIDTAYTLGVSRWGVFRRVILPASMPGIVDTLRIAFGWAWTYLVVAEIVAAGSGLGFMIMQAQRFLKTGNIIVGIIVIGVIGIIIDMVFKWLYGRMFPWMGKGGR